MSAGRTPTPPGAGRRAVEADGRPRQVILIITDTMGTPLVGAYGSPMGLTPRIDSFARSAVVFANAYTTCPLCTPARSSLHTGLPAAVNGAWSLEMPTGHTIVTAAQRLTGAGIRCAHIGKWHLSATDYFDTGDAAAGWDPRWWFDGRSHLESLPADVRARTRRLPRDGERPIHREHTFAAGVTDRSLRFIDAHRGEDFFLALSYDEPHAPSVSPEPFCGRHHAAYHAIGQSSGDDLADKPRSHRQWRDDPGLAIPATARVEGGRYYDQPYFACTAFVDDEIGKVLAAAAESAPDALVIITSDHGDMMGAHGLFKKGPALYQETVKAPLIVGRAGGGGPTRRGARGTASPEVAPGNAAAGTRPECPGAAGTGTAMVATPVSFLDVTPTLLAYFGVEGPGWLPGADLLEVAGLTPGGSRSAVAAANAPGAAAPAVGGALSDAAAGERAVFLEFGRFSPYNDGRGGFRPIRGIVTERHKLVVNLLDTDEFYDLESDPGETANLIDEGGSAGVRGELHDRLLEWMDQIRDPFRGPEWRYRRWREPSAYAWPNGGRPRLPDTHEKPIIDYLTGEERG